MRPAHATGTRAIEQHAGRVALVPCALTGKYRIDLAVCHADLVVVQHHFPRELLGRDAGGDQLLVVGAQQRLLVYLLDLGEHVDVRAISNPLLIVESYTVFVNHDWCTLNNVILLINYGNIKVQNTNNIIRVHQFNARYAM